MGKIPTFLFGLIFLQLSNVHADEFRVVTTLSAYAAIAKEIGAERILVDSIAAPRFNPHFIEPRPSDILKLKRCALFIHSGLDLEAWRSALVNAVARSELRQGGESQLDLSRGIRLLEVPTENVSRAEGDIHLFGNPHFWLDPRNGVVIAGSISDKLSALDPAGKAIYSAGLDRFTQKLKQKISEWSAQGATLRGRELVGYHNEWAYLMDFLGMKMNLFLEPKPGVPPSPQSIESIISQMRARKINAIVQSSYFDRKAAESVAAKTGARVLVLAQNVGELAGTEDYVSLIDYNVRILSEAVHG